MARTRNIKPSFFANEEIAGLSPLTRLLFIGLWTQADREGRLEDRPKRLKAAILPFDRYRIEDGLSALDEAGFIDRYQSPDGLPIIQILRFSKHQQPHPKEPSSVLPTVSGSTPSVSGLSGDGERTVRGLSGDCPGTEIKAKRTVRGSAADVQPTCSESEPDDGADSKGKGLMHDSCMSHASAMSEPCIDDASTMHEPDFTGHDTLHSYSLTIPVPGNTSNLNNPPDPPSRLPWDDDVDSAPNGAPAKTAGAEDNSPSAGGAGADEKPAKRRKPRTSAPDITPTPEMYAWAREHCGFDERRVNLETLKMLDHHRAKGSLMADWIAAWRTWLRNAVTFDRSRSDTTPITRKHNAKRLPRPMLTEQDRRELAEVDRLVAEGMDRDDAAELVLSWRERGAS